ncbi:hypothetical protein D3C72_1843190 [compost metagenome]
MLELDHIHELFRADSDLFFKFTFQLPFRHRQFFGDIRNSNYPIRMINQIYSAIYKPVDLLKPIYSGD